MGKFLRLLAFLWLAGTGAAEARLFEAEEFFLYNGLRVVVIPNHKAPIVQQMVWYNVGSVDEAPGKGGVAHLLEHLMFRGTEEVKDGEFNRLITENGGSMNAFTSRDVTVYHEFMDVSRLELAMFLEADRMSGLKITPETFEKERDIVFQERMQVVENNPTAYFSEVMQRNLWQEHPYARPITGTPEEILQLSQKDAEDFYGRYYAPNNAILILSGDITTAEAKDLSEKYFGNVEKKEIGKRIEFPEFKGFRSSKTLMKMPQINVSRMVRYYVVPSYAQDKNQALALTVLAKYLGDGDTSQLYRRLVEDEKSAVSVAAGYDLASRSYAVFVLSALTDHPEVFEKDLDEALREAIAAFDAEALQKAKKQMLAGIIYLKDNPADAAEIAGNLLSGGMSLEDVKNYDKAIEAVSLTDVRKAAARLLKGGYVQGFLLPEDKD